MNVNSANLVEALSKIGVSCQVTIPDKIATVDIAHVPTEQKASLAPTVVRINQQLKDSGLLGRWRAKVGGTSDERWILIVGCR